METKIIDIEKKKRGRKKKQEEQSEPVFKKIKLKKEECDKTIHFKKWNDRKKKWNPLLWNKNIMFRIYSYLNLHDFYCVLWTDEYHFSKKFVQYMNRSYAMFAKCSLFDHLQIQMGDLFKLRTISWMLNQHGFKKHADYINKKINHDFQYNI